MYSNKQNEKRYYRIGGIGILAEGPACREANYLAPFRTEELIPDLSVQMTMVDAIQVNMDFAGRGGWMQRGQELLLADKHSQHAIVRASYKDSGRIRVEIDQSRTECCDSRLLLQVLQLPHYVLRRRAVFLHASYIEYNGSAILFTAKSQTGKSTQAALWEKYRGAFVVNGDRTLLRKENGVWLACGSPYCGTSKICHNRTLPIRAVVILSQARVNTAQRADIQTAFTALLSGCSFEPACEEEVKAVTDIAGDLITSVPFYTLACTPDERAVTELERVL